MLFPIRYLKAVSETNAIDKSSEEAKNDFVCSVLQNSITIPPKDSDGNFLFVRFHLFPNKQFNPENTLQIVYKQAELAYLTMAVKDPKQKLEKRIFKIEYIKNAKLEQEFEKTKATFASEGKPTEEKLMFHGTHCESINGILANNFQLGAAPLQRSKGQYYGKGIYFSESPGVSIEYGILLLCRTLPGHVEDVGQISNVVSQIFKDTEIPDSFNSRKVSAASIVDPSVSYIHIFKSPKQILPFCIIHLFIDAQTQSSGSIIPHSKFFTRTVSVQPPQPQPPVVPSANFQLIPQSKFYIISVFII